MFRNPAALAFAVATEGAFAVAVTRAVPLSRCVDQPEPISYSTDAGPNVSPGATWKKAS